MEQNVWTTQVTKIQCGPRRTALTLGLAVCALCMLATVATAARGSSSKPVEQPLIGWQGEQYPSDHKGPGPAGLPSDAWLEVISWEPRIFVYHNFLSEEECDELVAKAKPRLARSGVVDNDSGGSKIDSVRTSSGMFFARGENEVLQAIEQRLAEWSLIPVEYGEGIQVLEYEIGQEYKPHFDYFFHKEGSDNGGNRMATVLMYLETPDEGGETVFPNVPFKGPADPTVSECAKGKVAVKARKRDAVLFFSLKTTGELDNGSNHGSCPVLKGTKWAATKWMHIGRYAVAGEKPVRLEAVKFKESKGPKVPGCEDQHDSCDGWAEAGECDKNPAYMVGDASRPGACLVSCGRCDVYQAAKSKGTA